jgi:hypothetical protein
VALSRYSLSELRGHDEVGARGFRSVIGAGWCGPSVLALEKQVTLRFKLQLVVMSDDQEVCVNDVVVLDKQQERLEHLGLSLAEAKTASVAPPCRWLLDGRLCLSRAPGHVGMPDWPATAPDPYRPGASTHALSSASRGLQPLPAKKQLHGFRHRAKTSRLTLVPLQPT